MGRLLYMIPFIGIALSIYFFFSFNTAIAGLISILALTQSIICICYIITQMIRNGLGAVLEIEVQLWDAIVPVIFLTLSAASFLHLTLNYI